MSCQTKRDIIVRPAQGEDYAGVLDISAGIHDGSDVVPARYFKYIAHPHKHPWVAVKDGKIVGFRILYYVGEGSTIIAEAERRDKSLKGANIMDLMGHHMYPFVLTKYPGILRRRILSKYTDYWENSVKSVEGTNIVMKRTVIHVAWDEDVENIQHAILPNQILRLPLELPIDHVTQATYQDVEHIFKDQTLCDDLFPEGIVAIGNQPFDASMRSTPRIVMAECSDVYITRTQNGVCQSISFGFVEECPGGTYCLFDYYGTEDCNVILGHLVKHVMRMPFYFSGNKMMMHCYLPTRLLNVATSNKIAKFIESKLQLNTGNRRPFQQYAIEFPIPSQYKSNI